MEHFNNAAVAPRKKGKESLILLIIGIIGVIGLVYVLNASGSKSAFSDNGPMDQQEMVVQTDAGTAF